MRINGYGEVPSVAASLPVAMAALLLYPVVWLLLLPFRILGIAVDGVLQFLRALLLLPARALGSRP